MQNTQISYKIITFLLFVCALSLSSVAAFYAIMGLMTLFSGAKMEIAIMGAVLEISKLVITSWLYRNWEKTPIILKTYFLSAIIILMVLTSMGVFGFLSKAHMEQGAISEEVKTKIDLIDEKIRIEKEKIDTARSSLAQLDKQVNEIIRRTENNTNVNAVDRSIAVRRQQTTERNNLNKQIEVAQTTINSLNEERVPKIIEYKKVEAEVGPIKYVASLIYGDSQDQTILEKSVKIVILLIVIVFDPLAVLMFIAFNQTIASREKYLVNKIVEKETLPEEDILIKDKNLVKEELEIIEKEIAQEEIEKKEEFIRLMESNKHKKKISIDSTIEIKDEFRIEKI